MRRYGGMKQLQSLLRSRPPESEIEIELERTWVASRVDLEMVWTRVWQFIIYNTNWLHDGNVKEDQQEDWNNNIEKSVEPENIDSDVPIVGPDNEIGYNDFEHIANLHSI